MLRALALLALAVAAAGKPHAVGVEVEGPLSAPGAPAWFLDFADEVRASFATIRADVATIRADVAVLAESVVTPTIAARVSQCSRSAVVFALIPGREEPEHTTCSAFPVPAEVLRASAAASTASASTSSFFLSSAHCFMDSTMVVVFKKANIHYFGGAHACSLVAHFVRAPPADSYDLALIECPTVAIPPSRISARPPGLQTPAVMIGFSRGEHIDASLTFVTRFTVRGVETVVKYAPHTKFTRLADSFQTPLPDVGTVSTVLASRGFTEDGLSVPSYVVAAASAGGYVEHSPPVGMSGGAIMDTDCGVFGVTERRSVHAPGGQFVRLTPDVVLLLAAAIPAPRNS